MCYLTDKEFLRIFRRETKKKKNAFQLLSVMFLTAFSASLLGILCFWDALIYEEARVFVAIFCLIAFLLACYTTYNTIILPLNVSIEIWRRILRLRQGRQMLDNSPLFNPSSITEPETSIEAAHSPEPIQNLARSPRAGRSHPYETRQAVSSRNAPAPVSDPVPVYNLRRSPRNLRPRGLPTVDISRRQTRVVPVQRAVRGMVVNAEVHREDESSLEPEKRSEIRERKKRDESSPESEKRSETRERKKGDESSPEPEKKK